LGKLKQTPQVQDGIAAGDIFFGMDRQIASLMIKGIFFLVS
jgi:hypothetical protein